MNTRVGRILYNGKQNVLWGAGKRGIDLLFFLLERDIHVAYFCDSDAEKHSIRIYNKFVVAPQEILCHREKYNIIVTPIDKQQQTEIINTIESAGYTEYVLQEEIGIGFSDLCINREYLYNLIRDSYTHRMILYGMGNEAIKILEILKILDIKIEYIVDEIDEKDRLRELDIDIKPLYSVLDETEYYKVIIPSAKDMKCRKKMEELGLKVRQEYNFFDDYRMMIPRSSILDPNLGFSFRVNGGEIPGFVCFGEKNDYKIVTLGGSTTDAARFPFKSWSQILYEKLEAAGIELCVICGGCIGYQTSQELVKLIRDVLPIKPDLLIDYSGYNDGLISRGITANPFLHQYQIDLFHEIAISDKCVRYGEQYLDEDNSPSYGVKSNWTVWDQYINNIKIMKGVCAIFGIRFFSFLQPWLATKSVYSKQEREMIFNYPDICSDRYYEGLLRFYDNKDKIDVSCMTDLTHIFDDHQDVYIDRVHVNEKGNAIIADKIIEAIKRVE